MWVKGRGRPPPCMAKEDAAVAAGGSMRTAAGREWTAAAWSSGEGRTAAARGRRASGGSRPFRTAEVHARSVQRWWCCARRWPREEYDGDGVTAAVVA
ncbi:hypothetical protein SESBI_26234 [Sesbania bispinosa]|nr:hypothetical protein SESBI_26234 [Sesbania bispinosa]